MAMGKAVMLVGPAGTGKTQLVMGALRSLMGKHGNDYVTSTVNMNFYTRYCCHLQQSTSWRVCAYDVPRVW